MHFNPKETWASTDAGRKKLVDALLSNSLVGQIGIANHDPSELPRRYLAPGNYSDLFRVYQSECLAQQQPAASASTFFRTLRASGWRSKIKFRGLSTHAQCRICHRLKSRIKHSADINAHAKSADQYMRHLGGVFADRQVYAQLKVRAQQQRDVLVLIIDSMDRSKFRLPRFSQGRTPKPLENKKRPELEFTAVITHGHAIHVFLADAEQSSGSDWSLEVLNRSLDKTFSKCQRSNTPWPSHLRLFTDNTPKESWNHLEYYWSLCFSPLLCQWLIFPSCSTLPLKFISLHQV